jgi:dTMP kinase
MVRSVFLSLDGLDGTGKSTQCRLLCDWLRSQGRIVTACVDPGGTEVGAQLREIVLHHRGGLELPCEALLFMASRAQLVGEVIRPALTAGHVVVSDRFTLANVVYQGHAGGLDPDLLWQVGRLATGGLEPELTVVLDLPPETALARRRRPADRMESRIDPVRVRAGFLTEARRRPDRVCVVDASGTVEAVQEAIRREVAPVLR